MPIVYNKNIMLLSSKIRWAVGQYGRVAFWHDRLAPY